VGVEESRERVMAAIKYVSFEFPAGRLRGARIPDYSDVMKVSL
jgi:hypothetical protein